VFVWGIVAVTLAGNTGKSIAHGVGNLLYNL